MKPTNQSININNCDKMTYFMPHPYNTSQLQLSWYFLLLGTSCEDVLRHTAILETLYLYSFSTNLSTSKHIISTYMFLVRIANKTTLKC